MGQATKENLKSKVIMKFESFKLLEKEIDTDHPLVGIISITERCPQCGFKIFQNKKGDEWCYNCGWNNYE